MHTAVNGNDTPGVLIWPARPVLGAAVLADAMDGAVAVLGSGPAGAGGSFSESNAHAISPPQWCVDRNRAAAKECASTTRSVGKPGGYKSDTSASLLGSMETNTAG